MRRAVLIIADTGFWVGLLDRGDGAHAVCTSALARCQEPLITTTPVLTETTHLLTRRRHSQVARDFLDLLLRLRGQGWFELFELRCEHLERQTQLMRQYADLPMDFADASLVLLAEELGHGRIFSTDRRDFGAYRWKNRQPFENLLGPLS